MSIEHGHANKLSNDYNSTAVLLWINRPQRARRFLR